MEAVACELDVIDLDLPTCPVCGERVSSQPGPGRPRRFCSDECLQQAKGARRKARRRIAAAQQVLAQGLQGPCHEAGEASVYLRRANRLLAQSEALLRSVGDVG